MHRTQHVGAAAVILGVLLLAAVVGAFVVSRDDRGGEARHGELAMRIDPVVDDARGAPAPRARHRRAARPVRLEIPAIGVDAPLIPLGLNADRSLEVPTDYGDAGWWTGGPRPGERGPAVIAGHVDSKTGPAVFYRIGDLEPGAAIAVVRRDGTRARFTVVGSERYPKADFPTARVYGRTRGATLRLITCSGVFDRASGHYLDNTVVYAVSA
jgi:sortase (surface protein transpeptidase)